MNQALRDLGDYVVAAVPTAVLGVEIAHDQLMIRVRGAAIVKLLTFLQRDQNCQFKQLTDLTAVDRPDREERFELVYNLLSFTHNQRIRIKLTTDETTPVASVCGVFSSANWYEREVWDLFGIFFADHPDLRRILTDYGFEGHPLRRDFPLTGYLEVRYDEDRKQVVYEPVKLPQEFRTFDFMSPWEGMLHLPGDKKAGDQKPETESEPRGGR